MVKLILTQQIVYGFILKTKQLISIMILLIIVLNFRYKVKLLGNGVGQLDTNWLISKKKEKMN